ncbi:MAG TPA: lysylphosphatidylglycerol synthase transmembrane domain-containing protein [Acidobacteriaceae bacterium]|nr:lysylphosphatidylglycerol synthase transmembrane domain-containing protein [Acidobacteriaceae bacterium]
MSSAPKPSHEIPAAQLAAEEPSAIRKLWPVALLFLVAALLWAFRHRIAFDPHTFAQQLRFVSPVNVLLALVAIYIGFLLRATRWAILLAPVRKSGTGELLPSQLIGFTAVALFGRVADLARPYLVARRLNTPVATQLAVYSIERAFDLAAAAILFSVTLAFAPRDMPHHEAFTRAGVVSLAATLFLAAFAATIRFAGDRLAALAGRLLNPISAKLAGTVAERILDFREGFRTIASAGQFFAALAVSLVIWLGIAITYLESARAFKADAVLGSMTFTGIMLLLATSLGASLFQLPVLGWFTQIAALATTYHTFYNVPLETASACGTISLITTSLSIIPAGLIAARLQGVSLRDASRTAGAPAPETPV